MWRQLLEDLLGGDVPSTTASRQAARWRQAVHRSYPRLAAPALCRSTGPVAAWGGRVPERAVLRGLVVASDEAYREGALLELEVHTAGAPILLVTRVEGVLPLPAGAPARYDVLLQVCDVAPPDVPRLQAVLDPSRPVGTA